MVKNWANFFNTRGKRLFAYYLRVAKKAKGLKGKDRRRSKAVSNRHPNQFNTFKRLCVFITCGYKTPRLLETHMDILMIPTSHRASVALGGKIN